MGAPSLLPSADELRLDAIVAEPDRITVVVRATAASACCPRCGGVSWRIHSHYHRRVADLPWEGIAVRLHLHARRFFCLTPTCGQRTFAERVPKTVARYGRRTTRLTAALDALAFALGGEPGARVADALGMRISPDTLLRLIHRTALPERPAPRILGIDDWAFRRGHRYGTILIDLERHRVVDLLDARSADAVAAWLRAHPGVEIVSRDRAHAYAEGIRAGAPDALQVADRFHLLKNIVEALQHVLERQHRQLPAAAAAATPSAAEPAAERSAGAADDRGAAQPVHLTRAQRASAERRERRHDRYLAVQRLHARGGSLRGITRALGVARNTMRRWLRAGHFPECAVRARRRCLVDRFVPHLECRWREGCRNATALWRELRARGFRGGVGTVRAWATALRRQERSASTAERRRWTAARPPSPRHAAWLLVRPVADLAAEEQRFVAALRARSPLIARVADLVGRFFQLLRERDRAALPAWLAQARVTGLHSFADGVARDRAAVEAAVAQPWSNGQVEGHVNRLKAIKRQMYGRAGFELLRRRVLHSA
jgi:transposase